jgi:hypothetical protein
VQNGELRYICNNIKTYKDMKRKITLLISLLALAISAGATNAYLYDFESDATSPLGFLTGGWTVPESVKATDNPVTSGINASATCFTFEAQDGIEWWGGPLLTVKQETTTSTMRFLYFKVLAEDDVKTNFQVGLFNGKDTVGNPVELGIYLNATRSTMLGKTWQEYCYMVPEGTTFDCIRLQPRHWGTYYIDDVRLSDEGPSIPDLKPFSLDFENPSHNDSINWINNSTLGNGATYIATVNDDPYNKATIMNNSNYCVRIWIQNGGWSDYDGGRYTGVYGYTTEKARYLHVRYFFLSNEDHPAQYNLPLCVFTEDRDSCYESMTKLRKQWNDVTIDLGVGTLIKYLAFNVNDYWVTMGIDDVQLDGNPTQREDLSGVASVQESGNVKIYAVNGTLRIAGITQPSFVQVYGITGMLHSAKAVTADSEISLQPGIYVVKVRTANNVQVQKVVVR